jgi:hypothetical protein
LWWEEKEEFEGRLRVLSQPAHCVGQHQILGDYRVKHLRHKVPLGRERERERGAREREVSKEMGCMVREGRGRGR